VYLAPGGREGVSEKMYPFPEGSSCGIDEGSGCHKDAVFHGEMEAHDRVRINILFGPDIVGRCFTGDDGLDGLS